jgi:hypothetical protein
MVDTLSHLVIRVDGGVPVGNPLTYTNFRHIHYTSGFTDLPDRQILLTYGYDIFYNTPAPTPPDLHNTVLVGYQFMESGSFWTQEWSIVPFTEEEILTHNIFMETFKWNRLRADRTRKLLECDWTQLEDAPISPELKQQWASYRTTLRDLPQNTVDIDNVIWPTPPV